MQEYSKRLVEVEEILRHMKQEDLQKIPNDILTAIQENKDKKYIWKYDSKKSLKNQNISRDTIAILSYLNIKYLLNEKQKKFMKQVHKLNSKIEF